MNWTKKKKNILINAGLVLAGIIIAVVLAEISLRLIIDKRPDRIDVADPLLLYKYLPGKEGGAIDKNGFRNSEILDKYDIIAIGDSQTFGMHTNDIWTKQLSEISRLSVYNMAVGGYGPVQYSFLTDKALQFEPKVIIWGLYLGNDIFDAYYLPYERDSTKYWSHLKNEEVERRLKAEKLPPFPYEEVNPKPRYVQIQEDPSLILKIRVFLRKHYIFYAFLGDRTRSWRERLGLAKTEEEIKVEYDRQWAKENPDLGFAYETEKIDTVFTSQYRLTVLDTNDPRIAEGLRISLDLIEVAKEKLDEAGVKFLIAIIPTKETVYSERLEQENFPVTDQYQKLIESEARVKKQIIDFLIEKEIYHVDILPAFQAMLQKNIAVYPHYHDGHPVVAGYLAIAESIYYFLKTNNLIN